MKTIYIKFLHENDVYAINPLFDLIPLGDISPPKICSRCGATLYIPLEISGNEFSASIPMGEVHKPHPIEHPDLVVVSEPDIPTLARKGNLSAFEQVRLKQFPNMSYVGNDGFEMSIADISTKYIEHKCDANKTLTA